MAEDVQLMMVGNTTNHPEKRVISYESAKRFANERGLMYIEANTDHPESVNKAFVTLATECINFSKIQMRQQGANTKNRTNCSFWLEFFFPFSFFSFSSDFPEFHAFFVHDSKSKRNHFCILHTNENEVVKLQYECALFQVLFQRFNVKEDNYANF
ncbi:GTP-binding nuclear protein RAN1 [Reticulomyxa filosa]|uniref:GTP-binding nuclear protein RAN1 n=1 Tax=Reticulomyxa filosa TaxID=46433 RepID=X6NUA7_RETFI|nr:GTP-binding nuclear protein RAN1 [Reticulomyxa filosa]|eukprot:ETO29865.1 GTP-binding nuclear protein RAN1 [Reticulomyxa filosa]